MKKLIRFLFFILLLGVGFLYVVKNPELGISQTILKAIGLERLLSTGTADTTGYVIEVPKAGISFTYPVNLQSMPVDAYMEYDGAEGKVRDNHLYVGGISGQAMVKFTQKPYHIVDGIDDYSITVEQKDAFLTNRTCPWTGRVCNSKKLGDYDILYAYGIESYDTSFINMHVFILASDTFVYVDDEQIDTAVKNIAKEDEPALLQKIKDLGLDEESAMYNNDYLNFETSLIKQQMQNITGALANAITYVQGFVESMTMLTGALPLTNPALVDTGTEATGTEDTTLDTQATIGKYTIKTEQGKDIAGENIYLYDASGKKVFSLMAKDGDLQGVYDIVGDYLIVDVGSDLMRELRIYDILNNKQIFTSSYPTQPLFPDDQKGYDLHIEGNKVLFSTLVYDKRQFNSKRQIAIPKIIPTCPTKRTEDEVGYSELRSFDLDTKQVTKTGKIVCTFMQ